VPVGVVEAVPVPIAPELLAPGLLASGVVELPLLGPVRVRLERLREAVAPGLVELLLEPLTPGVIWPEAPVPDMLEFAPPTPGPVAPIAPPAPAPVAPAWPMAPAPVAPEAPPAAPAPALAPPAPPAPPPAWAMAGAAAARAAIAVIEIRILRMRRFLLWMTGAPFGGGDLYFASCKRIGAAWVAKAKLSAWDRLGLSLLHR
jgi:hypothetical protein